MALLEAPDGPLIDAFIAERLSPAYRQSMDAPTMAAHLRALRTAARGSTDDVRVEQVGEGIELILEGARTVVLGLQLDAEGRLDRFELLRVGEPEVGTVWTDLTWDNLADRLRAAEAESGFSGVVLARRGGAEILREAYGMADQTAGRPTRLDTVYGIGSTPIDFTVTGILLLGQRGQLELDEPLSRYLDGVPADKSAITLRHLMTGASGLPNFHDVPETDWDPDLAWIDREGAVRRILAQRLLFEPGQGDEHSHSAYGLLAAVIEVVSGKSYRDFIRSELLQPLGMTRTGFYGETLDLDVEDFASGYGASSVGLPNIPPNWGPTSWLVMGSGGMFSTLDDMDRYYRAWDTGQLLAGEWATWFQGESFGVGGSDRGFFILEAADGLGDRILLLMNGEGRSAGTRALTQAVAQLVLQRALPVG